MSRMPAIYDEIRKAITESDKSRYRMAIETGISEAQLCQFMAGTKGLSVEALETLADCLGLVITARPVKRQSAKKRGR